MPSVLTWQQLARTLGADDGWRARATIAMSDALVRTSPELGEDSALADAMRSSIEENVRLFAAMAAADEDAAHAAPGPAAIDFIGLLVRRRVPSSVLAGTYRVSHGVFWRAWTERLHGAFDGARLGDALERSSTYMFAFMDALTERALREHDDARARWVRQPDAVRGETIRALLDGSPLDARTAERRLGHALDRPHIGVVAWADGGDREELERVVRRVLEPLADAAAGGGGGGVPMTGAAGGAGVLVHALGRDAVAGWASHPGVAADGVVLPAPPDGSGVRVAAGTAAPGVDGFRRTHLQAIAARRVARLSGAAPGSVTRWEDVAVAALASADLEQAERFVREQLGPLAEDAPRARTLAETLRVHLEEQGSGRATAGRLGVHENTVANRLARARATLGRPVEGRVADVLLALRLLPVVR